MNVVTSSLCYIKNFGHSRTNIYEDNQLYLGLFAGSVLLLLSLLLIFLCIYNRFFTSTFDIFTENIVLWTLFLTTAISLKRCGEKNEKTISGPDSQASAVTDQTDKMPRFKRSVSMPNIRTVKLLDQQENIKKQQNMTQESTLPSIIKDQHHAEEDSKPTKERKGRRLCFRRRQSNCLYSAFLIWSLLLFGFDFGNRIDWSFDEHQGIPRTTKWMGMLLAFNLLLWLDFMSQEKRITKEPGANQSARFEGLLQDSTNTLFCLIISPIVLWQGLCR